MYMHYVFIAWAKLISDLGCFFLHQMFHNKLAKFSIEQSTADYKEYFIETYKVTNNTNYMSKFNA